MCLETMTKLAMACRVTVNNVKKARPGKLKQWLASSLPCWRQGWFMSLTESPPAPILDHDEGSSNSNSDAEDKEKQAEGKQN